MRKFKNSRVIFSLVCFPSRNFHHISPPFFACATLLVPPNGCQFVMEEGKFVSHLFSCANVLECAQMTYTKKYKVRGILQVKKCGFRRERQETSIFSEETPVPSPFLGSNICLSLSFLLFGLRSIYLKSQDTHYIEQSEAQFSSSRTRKDGKEVICRQQTQPSSSVPD